MLDELAIYNLSVKYPNTIDLVREVERIAKAEAIDECIKILTDDCKCEYEKLTCFECMAIKMEQLKEQKNDK